MIYYSTELLFASECLFFIEFISHYGALHIFKQFIGVDAWFAKSDVSFVWKLLGLSKPKSPVFPFRKLFC